MKENCIFRFLNFIHLVTIDTKMKHGKIYNFRFQTPLIESPKISEICQRKVVLKLDNLQPAGSFKIRGIGHLIQHGQDRVVNPYDMDHIGLIIMIKRLRIPKLGILWKPCLIIFASLK